MALVRKIQLAQVIKQVQQLVQALRAEFLFQAGQQQIALRRVRVNQVAPGGCNGHDGFAAIFRIFLTGNQIILFQIAQDSRQAGQKQAGR